VMLNDLLVIYDLRAGIMTMVIVVMTSHVLMRLYRMDNSLVY
jgi:hypothetical protein